MLSPRYVRIVMSWIYENRRVICRILPHEMTQIMRPFIADCKSMNWQAQKETTAPFSSREANCRVFHKKRHIQSHLTAD